MAAVRLGRRRALVTVASAVVLSLFAAPLAYGALNFSTTDYHAGGSPVAVAVGQFNADSNPDLAVANEGGGDISILLGTGAGGFTGPTNFAAGGLPTSVAVGNFNADSNADLAVVANDTNTIQVLLGNGTGGFGGPTNVATSATILDSAVVGKFNADANADIAVTNVGVGIVLGNGMGGFGPLTTFAAGPGGPSGIALGDFQSDGNSDLAVTNGFSHNVVTVLLGNGSGGFMGPTDFATGSTPESVATGEFDGNDDLDLTVANCGAQCGGAGSGNVSVLLGNGTGGFGGPTNFPAAAGPMSLTVSDFDGDGHSDIGVANFSSGNVSILLGDGGSFSEPTNFVAGAGPTSIAQADFDADGSPDLAVANMNSGNVSILLNLSTSGIEVLPTTLAFADQLEGTISPAQTITVTNTGHAALMVALASTTGANPDDFLVSGNTCTGQSIQSGATCQIRLRFAPSGTGVRTASLELTSNAPGEPRTVALAGIGAGTPPAPAASPAKTSLLPATKSCKRGSKLKKVKRKTRCVKKKRRRRR